MKVKKLCILGVAVLLVAGMVLTAGCTSNEGTTYHTISTVVTDANGTVISSTASGDLSIETKEYGVLKVSVTDQDPVVGIWLDEHAQDDLYKLFGDSSGTGYLVDADGVLYDPVDLQWGKVENRENSTYLIKSDSSYRLFTYSAAEDTLTDWYDDAVYTRTEVTGF